MKRFLTVLLVCGVAWSALAEDQSSGLPSVPYGLSGMYPYAYVLAGYSEDGKMIVQLIRASEDTTNADYLVVDSFSCSNTPRPCGGNSISYVTQEDSCFHIVTLGPLPGTERDTVITSCLDSVYWDIGEHFFVKAEGLFAYAVFILRGDPVESNQCIIGRIGEERMIDTVASIQGGRTCRLLPDETEVSVDVKFNTEAHRATRTTVGIYDLQTDKLLIPLDTTWSTWGAYRLSRDEPLYYIKNHPVYGVNVWRWSEEWGEELVTFFVKPDVLRNYQLTADSVICFVGIENDSASTGITRVAVPLNPE